MKTDISRLDEDDAKLAESVLKEAGVKEADAGTALTWGAALGAPMIAGASGFGPAGQFAADALGDTVASRFIDAPMYEKDLEGMNLSPEVGFG